MNYNTINAEQAVSCFKQGDYKKAIEIFDMCEDEYPSDEQLYIRSILYFQEREFEKCFCDLNKVIAYELYCVKKRVGKW